MNDDSPRATRHVRCTPLLLLILLVAGCKGFDTPFNTGSDDDPLLPGGRIGNKGASTAQQPAPTNGPGQPISSPTPTALAPPPGTLTGNTPAALTATGVRPADPQTDPRWNGPASGAPTDPSGWKQASPTTPGVVPVSGGQRVETLEQGYALLESYGMNWDKMSRLGQGEEYKFECTIPSRQTPGVSQYYEGRGIGRLGAMRAVVDDIARRSSGN